MEKSNIAEAVLDKLWGKEQREWKNKCIYKDIAGIKGAGRKCECVAKNAL